MHVIRRLVCLYLIHWARAGRSNFRFEHFSPGPVLRLLRNGNLDENWCEFAADVVSAVLGVTARQ